MKFLTRPEFLVALAAWVVALGVQLGLDLDPELVFGAASLVSIASGGVALKRNKKGSSAAGLVLACTLLGVGVVGCGSTALAVQGYLKNYPHAVIGEFDGIAANDFNYVMVRGSGAGEFVVRDRVKGTALFSFPVSGSIEKAWKVVIGEDKPSFREVPYEEARLHFAEAGIVGKPVVVIPNGAVVPGTRPPSD
jgi:hypothetical protein